MSPKSIFAFVVVILLELADAGGAGPPPPLEDHFLDNFVGDWKVERKMGKVRVVESSVRGEWVLQHHFLQLHYGAGGKAPEYEALVHIGFIDSDKTYVCYWIDVWGAGYDGPGQGKIDDKLLSIEFKFGHGELTNKFTFDPQTKTWTSLIRQQEKGEWKTFAEEKWIRK
jgi:hypothetical protein